MIAVPIVSRHDTMIVSNTCNIRSFVGKSGKEMLLMPFLMSCDYLCLFLPPGGMRGGRKVIVEPHKHKGELLCTVTYYCGFCDEKPCCLV